MIGDIILGRRSIVPRDVVNLLLLGLGGLSITLNGAWSRRLVARSQVAQAQDTETFTRPTKNQLIVIESKVQNIHDIKCYLHRRGCLFRTSFGPLLQIHPVKCFLDPDACGGHSVYAHGRQLDGVANFRMG